MTWKIVLLLVLGLLIRLWDPNRPFIDAHDIRQVHTAVVTQNLQKDGYPLIACRSDWNGNDNDSILLEFPLLNHLSGHLADQIGEFELAGRLVVVAFWVLSFLIYYKLISRMLPEKAVFPACFVYVFCPLSVFFGQSYQPESLMLLLNMAVLWVWAGLLESESWKKWIALGILVCLGIIIKANEVVQLSVPILCTGLYRWKRGFFAKPHVWIIGVAAVLTTIFWMGLMQKYNGSTEAGWEPGGVLYSFLGSPWKRLEPMFYLKMAAYVAVLVATPMGCIIGLWSWPLFRSEKGVFWSGWLAGILFYYLVFGPGGPSVHSYYHLVAMPLYASMIGYGFFLLQQKRWGLDRSPVQVLVLILFMAGCLPGYKALYTQDHTAYNAAKALESLVPNERDLVLVAADHRRHTSGFNLYPTLFFYSGTRGYNLPASGRENWLRDILEKKSEVGWLVQTFPVEGNDMAFRSLLPMFSRVPEQKEDLKVWAESHGFTRAAGGDGYVIYRHEKE